MWHRGIKTLLITLLFVAVPVHAAFSDELQALQQRWAMVRYQTNGDERKTRLKKLVDEADAFTQKYPARADGYIWAAVVRGSLAEVINGLSALGIVKEAKADLEKAIAIDPNAEDGYAYGILGLMYARVPGWPIGFGSDKKAKEMLRKGIESSPNGMNINYFNAEYAFDNGDYKVAQGFIDKAARASPPAPAAVWNGRRQEIRELAANIRKKLN